jgi:hypothetical protein
MTVELIGIITVLVGIVSIFCGPAFIVTAFFCSTLLGSAAAFTLPELGGTSIQPAHVLLGFLAVRLLFHRDPRRMTVALAPGGAGFWLMFAVLWSALSAYILPRLFAGEIFVFPMRTTGYSLPLEPGTSNFTQSVYLFGDFLCFLVLYSYGTSTDGRRVMEGAALLCVVLNLVFAGLDLATYYTNSAELLSFIRNANYGLLNEVEAAGVKRIVGSFVEASSFGAATLGYFAFAGKLWLQGVHSRLTLTLAGLSFLALLFSTSSTAYAGLAAFLLVAYSETAFDALRRQLTPQGLWFLASAPIIALIAAISIGLNDTASAYVGGLLDDLVFNKMSSESGVERSSWNSQGLQNFVDTFGFGVGNGSMRASSFPVSVLASLGIIGAVTIGLFLVRVFQSRAREDDPIQSKYRKAVKYTCLGWIIAATVSGALVDLGLPFFTFAALACSRIVSPIKASKRAALAEPSAVGSAAVWTG